MSSTRRLSLMQLPFEIVELIADHLANDCPPSVKDVALINRASYACSRHAAKSIVPFHTIKIRPPDDRSGLGSNMEHLVEKISTAGGLGQVQRLEIGGGCLSVDTNPITLSPVPISTSGHPRNDWFHQVVYFIELLTALVDLVYDCDEMLPPYLLEVLPRCHPRCRLHHLYPLVLYGLVYSREPIPYEIQLATSPLLHKVKVCTSATCLPFREMVEMAKIPPYPSSACLYYTGSRCWYNDFLLRILGLAPNLKEVSLGTEFRQHPGPASLVGRLVSAGEEQYLIVYQVNTLPP